VIPFNSSVHRKRKEAKSELGSNLKTHVTSQVLEENVKMQE
jgi:hypothetical protein